MLRRLVNANIHAVKEENTSRGLTKRTVNEQKGAVNALVDLPEAKRQNRFPNLEQLEEIIGG